MADYKDLYPTPDWAKPRQMPEWATQEPGKNVGGGVDAKDPESQSAVGGNSSNPMEFVQQLLSSMMQQNPGNRRIRDAIDATAEANRLINAGPLGGRDTARTKAIDDRRRAMNVVSHRPRSKEQVARDELYRQQAREGAAATKQGRIDNRARVAEEKMRKAQEEERIARETGPVLPDPPSNEIPPGMEAPPARPPMPIIEEEPEFSPLEELPELSRPAPPAPEERPGANEVYSENVLSPEEFDARYGQAEPRYIMEPPLLEPEPMYGYMNPNVHHPPLDASFAPPPFNPMASFYGMSNAIGGMAQQGLAEAEQFAGRLAGQQTHGPGYPQMAADWMAQNNPVFNLKLQSDMLRQKAMNLEELAEQQRGFYQPNPNRPLHQQLYPYYKTNIYDPQTGVSQRALPNSY